MAVVSVLALAGCGHASSPSGPAGHAGPTYSSAATIENLPSPTPLVGVADPGGSQVVEAVPSPGSTSKISGQEAVDAAWVRMPDYVRPSSVVADFGMMEGHPSWFVTFSGICMSVSGGPPGASPVACPITRMTVEIDADNGEWIHSYW
jgi:hypothetical protein